MSEQNISAADAVEREGNPTPQNGGSADPERKFSQADVEKIVQDRLNRERKSHQKQLSETAKKPSGPDSQDLQSKLIQYEERAAAQDRRIAKMRSDSLKATLDKTLVEHGCNDPELLSNYFLSRSQVQYDEDDNIIVDGASTIEDLVRSELAKRPHLVKPKQTSGTGSRAPGAVQPPPSSIKNMTPEQYATWKEQQGIGIKKSLF